MFRIVFYFMLFSCLFSLVAFVLVRKPILFLEVVITAISSFSYSLFLKIKDLQKISIFRYYEWAFTTPLMLIALALFSNITSLLFMFTVVLLNLVMRGFGYLGETKRISKVLATGLGFTPLLLIFYMFFKATVFDPVHYLIFLLYFVVWSAYGVAYLFRESLKNKCMNVFDAVAKGVVAVIFAAYYLQTTFAFF